MMFRNANLLTTPLPQRARSTAGLAVHALTGLALALCTLSATATAQVAPPGLSQANAEAAQPAKPEVQIDEANDTVLFSLDSSHGMPLIDFIQWAQEVTGKRFTYNVQELTSGSPSSAIHLLGTLSIKRERFQEDFYSFFQTMLYIKGFAIVPRGEGDLEVLEIIMMQGMRGREVTNGARYVAPDEVEQYRNQTGVPILTTVKLRSINAQLANNALRPFFASTGGSNAGGSVTIGNVGNHAALLLQGFGPQVYAAVQLLKLVDEPAKDSHVVGQIIVLEHQTPEELEPILSELLLENSRQQGQASSAGPAGSREGLKVVAHRSQRALVLRGEQEQVREALDLIARLDVPSIPTDGSANVIYLKHVLAEDLANTLKQFLTEDHHAETTAATSGTASAAAPRRTRKTVIQAHKESNSLLVSAAGSKWKQVQALIDKLDQPQPHALTEAQRSNKTDHSRGFGFTSFGQSTFQDTDEDGLPDTRLPNFDNPLQDITNGMMQAVGTPSGGAKVIYLKGGMAEDLQARLKRFLAEEQKQGKKQASVSVSPRAATKKAKNIKSKSVIF